MITFKTTRERVAPPKAQKENLKEDLKNLFKNRPWVILFFVGIISFVMFAMQNLSVAYYFKYYMGDENGVQLFNVIGTVALIVAIPSFRTRGDYLAIISLAFLFIVKSFFENMQSLGGARGIMGQPDWATLPVIFIVVIIGIWAINNFVTSTLGKALNAVRDDEMAANAMTVDTRKTKMVAFLFGAFWAGLAGGLLAHVLRFINPAMFGIQKLAEVLAMVYFGGLNSVYGSIVGAVSISLLGEVLRPLEILKWIFIPLLLILVMIYRPTGLVAFKELDVHTMFGPKEEA